jgi:trimeric autotransporter adhesin
MNHQRSCVWGMVLSLIIGLCRLSADSRGPSQAGPPGPDLDGIVNALAAGPGALYAGGDFVSCGDQKLDHVARWDGKKWSALGLGVDGAVDALAASGKVLFVGGRFTTAGGIPANHIAQWDGKEWSALGPGVDGRVSALAVSGKVLYVGGQFLAAGGIKVNHIARWDGSKWAALGSGMNNDVTALALSGGDLIAAGNFTKAGDNSYFGIAWWDGKAWRSAQGTAMGFSPVNALAVGGKDIYSAYGFRRGESNAIAKWHGRKWSRLGFGIWPPDYLGEDDEKKLKRVLWELTQRISALAVSRGLLYAGGKFETADEAKAKRIAEWDGRRWAAVGQGISWLEVKTLAAKGKLLYAGGATLKDNHITGLVATWDGKTWTVLRPK